MKFPLYTHQIETFDFGVRQGSYADLSEMGTGKTLSALTVLDYHASKDKDFKAIVVAPKTIITSGWIGDAQKAYPNLNIIPVIGSTKKKLEAFNEKATIYVTNYETFHQNWDLSDAGIKAIVCDEAVKLKNHKAGWTEAITEFSQDIPIRIILSGLITPNNLMEIYGAFNFLYPGCLGGTYWQFRGRYFTIDPLSHNNTEYVQKAGAEEAIMKVLRPYIIRHTKKECLDLPDKVHGVRHVEMTGKQSKYYKELERNAVVELEDVTIGTAHKAGLLMKLAQVSSGFMYDSKSDVHTFNSAKTDELASILEGELAGEQVLIFCNFRGEIQYFKEHYPEASFITGGQKTEDQEENIKRFKDGTNRLCFANISASKYGLTLTNTANVIYYSLNYSLDDYAQSQDRIHRIGQTRTCNYTYLLSTCGKPTVDHKIYDALMGKKSLNDLIISMIENNNKQK